MKSANLKFLEHSGPLQACNGTALPAFTVIVTLPYALFCLQVQFVTVIIHSSLLLIFECNYPKLMAYYIMANTAYFLYLFREFYKITYRSKKDA